MEEERIRKLEEWKILCIRRETQLRNSYDVINTVLTNMDVINRIVKEAEIWDRLMICDGLPDPMSVPELNRYLTLWQENDASSSLEGCFAMTPQVNKVITELEATMKNESSASSTQQHYWREIWLSLQETQKEKLNLATYGQLLDMRPHLNMETLVYSFLKSSPLVSLALWCNTSRSPKNNIHQVEELGFTFQLPVDLVEKECIIRVIKTEYDHCSKFARTYSMPTVEESNANLLGYSVPKPKEPVVEMMQVVPEMEDNNQAIEPMADEAMEVSEGEEEFSVQRSPYMSHTSAGELNLRQHRVQGGIYTLDLLKMPPQPREVSGCTITQVERDRSVVNLRWQAAYNPPPPPDANEQRRRDPEEVEKEMRLLEMELQKLILITIKLPESAYWFEPPTMVRWDNQRAIWTTDGFHDAKYNEDTRTLQVRSICLGVMGLAMNRFANLPYQNWEVSAKDTNSATLQLYGSVISAEFTIGEGEMCAVSIQYGNSSALSHLYGNFMKPELLIEKLRFYGINIFPDKDSFCYMDGLPRKHPQTERHLYTTMGLLASCLDFQWSRWNLLAGESSIVFQMKIKGTEFEEGVGQPLVLVTPVRTAILECTELSQALSEEPRCDMQYYADLYQMAVNVFGDDVTELCNEASSHFTHTVGQILQCSSILSYC